MTARARPRERVGDRCKLRLAMAFEALRNRSQDIRSFTETGCIGHRSQSRPCVVEPAVSEETNKAITDEVGKPIVRPLWDRSVVRAFPPCSNCPRDTRQTGRKTNH